MDSARVTTDIQCVQEQNQRKLMKRMRSSVYCIGPSPERCIETIKT